MTEVAVGLEKGAVVVAVGGRERAVGIGKTVFVFIAETAGDGEVRQELVIRLGVERTSCSFGIEEARVYAGEIEDGLAGDAEAVGSVDGDEVAEIIRAEVERCAREGVEGRAGGRWIFGTQALLTGSELKNVVPVLCGLVLECRSPIGIAIVLEGLVGYTEEGERVGIAEARCGVANGETDIGGCGGSPAEISGVGGIVKFAVGQAVVGVEAREFGEIVELVKCAGDGYVV